MTGLILKDALVLKKSLKSYLLLLAVYAVLTVTGLFCGRLFRGHRHDAAHVRLRL